MKTFTIKDFVGYNNPCKMCGRKVSFSLVPVSHNENVYSRGIYPMFRKNLLYFNLWIKYKEKLAISLNPLNNNFKLEGESEDLSKLMKEYKEENNLVFDITCDSCKTQIISSYLEFENNYVKPFTLSKESLIAITENYSYVIRTEHDTDKSFIVAEKVRRSNEPPFTLEIPLLPLSKIKNKENLIKKIKLYMTLS